MARSPWHNFIRTGMLRRGEQRFCRRSWDRTEGMHRMPTETRDYWTHTSVLGLAKGSDPIEVIVAQARRLVLSAMESGWTGPPFDPFTLAEHLGIPVLPRDDIKDARMVPASHSPYFRIEYNPNRPIARIRYSIAHEIAHSLFPDCRERVRHRVAREKMQGDEWQLEMLCNIAASELLMPVGSFPELAEQSLSIDNLVGLRTRYGVSVEALLLRFARLTDLPCFVFAVSRREDESDHGRYQVDYVVFPADWRYPVETGALLPPETAIRGCTAIGFTSKSDEEWTADAGELHVEAVGISPYPDRSFPRVMGFAAPRKRQASRTPRITYLKGDATKPRGSGPKLLVHVVNDRTPRWGGGFARVVRTTWPDVQNDFIRWVESRRGALRLGVCRVAVVDEGLTIISMICQHGYGESPTPRIRYNALETCLCEVAAIADQQAASVHMPRIGCGQAGGSWDVVRELVEDALLKRGISVTVYDVVGQEPPVKSRGLFPA